MGIRGTVRRSTDSNIVHCNVDTDVVVWEGDAEGSSRFPFFSPLAIPSLRAQMRTRTDDRFSSSPADPNLKPPEVQSLIENFCLGTRRLHLYGSPHALRRGWLTVSSPYPASSPTPTKSSSTSSSPAGPSSSPQPMYSSSLSPIQLIEKEGLEAEQKARWGRPREWKREEWEGRWRRPGTGMGLGRSASGRELGGGVEGEGRKGGEGGDGAGEEEEVVRVESLLPFVQGASPRFRIFPFVSAGASLSRAGRIESLDEIDAHGLFSNLFPISRSRRARRPPTQIPSPAQRRPILRRSRTRTRRRTWNHP